MTPVERAYLAVREANQVIGSIALGAVALRTCGKIPPTDFRLHQETINVSYPLKNPTGDVI